MDKSSFLITGVANEQSLAWSIASYLLKSGSECYFGVLPSNLARVRRLVRSYGLEEHVLPLDVSDEASLAALVAAITPRVAKLDGVLHSIAYAPLEDLAEGPLAVSRDGFRQTMDVSVYSLIALVRGVRTLLGASSSVVAMSYYGAEKCVPGYDLMGVAKAGLESLVRYLAYELGPAGIRINSLSAGPVLTLSSSVFEDIEEKIALAARRSPLRRPTTPDDVAATAKYLFGAHSSGLTGQTIHVDCGLSVTG